MFTISICIPVITSVEVFIMPDMSSFSEPSLNLHDDLLGEISKYQNSGLESRVYSEGKHSE